jgi:hypothetical protein
MKSLTYYFHCKICRMTGPKAIKFFLKYLCVTNLHPFVIYVFIIIAAACLFLGTGSYFATMRIVDHVGNPIGLSCIECPLILPMLIRISGFAVVGTTAGALAVWLNYRKEKRMQHGPLAEDLKESKVDLNQEAEQAMPEVDRPKPKRNFVFPFPKSKVKGVGAE